MMECICEILTGEGSSTWSSQICRHQNFLYQGRCNVMEYTCEILEGGGVNLVKSNL